jgi:hypothetical protein
MDENRPLSCPVVGFGISDVETSGSTCRQLTYALTALGCELDSPISV